MHAYGGHRRNDLEALARKVQEFRDNRVYPGEGALDSFLEGARDHLEYAAGEANRNDHQYMERQRQRSEPKQEDQGDEAISEAVIPF